MTRHRTVWGAAAASAVLAAAVLTQGTAQAAPTATTDVSKVAASLGSRSAGSWLDGSGKLTVAVTDAAAAARVRSAGGVAKVVTRSAAQLQAAQDTLFASARVPGTAWAVDPASNQVLVSVDSTVTGAKLAKVKAAVAKLGSAARLETVPGAFRKTITGGDPIYGGGYRCSLGFNVRNSAGQYFFLTAGHCGNIASSWYANSSRTQLLGSVTGSSFPNNDYAIVRYSTSYTNHPGTVGSQDITSAGTPTVNQTVTRRGSTTGIRSGRVTALNATVTYAEGTVRGLIRTTVCAEGGDSGGSLYQGTVAYGLTSGGSGNCTTGGTTFFQPVTEALSVYGVSVY